MELREQPEFKKKGTVALNELEAAVLVTPPDNEWPSGILSIQVHEIRDLSVKQGGRDRRNVSLRGMSKKPVIKSREGEKGQNDWNEIQEETDGLPSSYCEMCVCILGRLPID